MGGGQHSAGRADPAAPGHARNAASTTLDALLRTIHRLIQAGLDHEHAHAHLLAGMSDDSAPSARNLLHYLALRSSDLRDLQGALADLGLSSLGRNESHVLDNLRAVAGALDALLHAADPARARPKGVSTQAPTASRGRRRLESRAAAILGPPQPGRDVRIMVTLPSEAADDESLIDRLIAAGMNCARINTAHDSPQQWERMCSTVRSSAQRQSVQCRVLIDLAGPKLRTGPFEPGPQVLRLRPKRDALGRVTAPAEAVFRALSQPPREGAPLPEIPVPPDWLERLSPGDSVVLRDARERRRVFKVVGPVLDGRVSARTDRTTYLIAGTSLTHFHSGRPGSQCRVGPLHPLRQFALLKPGDRLRLHLGEGLGRPATAGPDAEPAIITCTLPQAFARARIGERVWFDDGKVCAEIRQITPDAVDLVVTLAAPAGDKIFEDKGINLPDSLVPIAGLTADDKAILPVVARLADMVGLSFVQTPADYAELRAQLHHVGRPDLPVILKIETRKGFENLPSILLAALRHPPAGLMIARGDLAVECGFERLAEVQEEILWLCEAAHMPVVWATQVLESLAKTGRASRAEITDAAMSERAECVMLNKGPHIVDAVRLLDGVLRRMCEHQDKKRPMLRALNVARRFGSADQH